MDYSAHLVFRSLLLSRSAHFPVFICFSAIKSNGFWVIKQGDAIAAMTELMNNMPEAPDQFEDSRISALKKIETDRITKASIFWNRERLTKLGINSDVRKEKYEAIQKMSIADIKTFFENNIKERFYTYIIIGKRENTDIELLKSLGEYKELTLEEIFGY